AAVTAALDDSGLDLERRPAAEIDPAELERVHPPAYVRHILDASPAAGLAQLDPDTALSPGSVRAARLAAGAVGQAVAAAAAGKLTRAFCAVRPPGHHAEPNQAMGFCLFSSVAVAARMAQAAGLRRV